MLGPRIIIMSLFLCLFAPSARAEIIIGVAGPMTGGLAAFGEEIAHGAELAADDINHRGGLLGQQVRIMVEDDACDPKQARSVANKMVSAKAFAVIGHWCAAASMPASEVYAEEGLIQIDPGALLTDLTHQGFPGLFRVSATDKLFAAALGSIILTHNPGGKIAIVTDRVAVTMALTKYLQDFFAATPNKIISVEQISAGEKDFSSLVDKMKNAHPDAIICACFTVEAGLLGRQMAEKKLDADYYGWDTFTSPDFPSIMGSNATDKVAMIDYARPPDSESYKAFVGGLQKKKWPIETTTIMSYTALQLLADAITTAKSLDTQKVAAVLHHKEFNTIIGKVAFDAYGDRVHPDFGAYRWDNGKLENTGQVVYQPMKEDQK